MKGRVIVEYGPWIVVRKQLDRGAPKRGKTCDVVDTSGPRPQRVHGPTSERDARAYASANYQIWMALKGQGSWTG